MGIILSCLSKNNKVGVVESEETYQLHVVRPPVVTDELLEAKGGVAFSLTFGASEKPKLPPTCMVNGSKEEDFEKWRVSQEKVQLIKQKKAQDYREKERIQKQIETAQKEMERLEKYVNLKEK